MAVTVIALIVVTLIVVTLIVAPAVRHDYGRMQARLAACVCRPVQLYRASRAHTCWVHGS
jgi:hypothetical protein